MACAGEQSRGRRREAGRRPRGVRGRAGGPLSRTWLCRPGHEGRRQKRPAARAERGRGLGADPAWPVPGSLDPDPGNGRSDAAGSTGRAAAPLEHPCPPPRPPPVLAGAHSQQVIRRPPHSGIVFRSFSFATV